MDQTGFNQNQQIFQAPPEPEKPVVAQPSPEERAKKKKQQTIAIAVVTVIVVLVGLVFLVTQVIMPVLNPTKVIPTPPSISLPSPATRPQSEFGKRLEDIEEQIDATDPKEVDLDPPLINTKIRL